MIAKIEHRAKEYQIDLDKGIDISIPMGDKNSESSAWYVDPIDIQAVRGEGFTGSVAEGGSVNFRNISFNPHGNGTHTECLGHITEHVYSVNRLIKPCFAMAKLISVEAIEGSNDPEFTSADDLILPFERIKAAYADSEAEAIVIRTIPNENKLHRNWSESNWPQLDVKAAAWMAEKGIKHLLIDLPSVDREFDGGKLLCHHAFWNIPAAPRKEASITEMIFVADEVEDGEYVLQLNFAAIENDASPSRPILYAIS